MSRFSLILGGALWIGVFAGLFYSWQSRKQPVQAADDSGEPAGQLSSDTDTDSPDANTQPGLAIKFPARRLPEFEFDEVMGGKLSLEDLKGKRWVASFVFSRCTETCPIISSAVMQVHDKVKDVAPEILFVSFTVDPKHDTVDVFRQYSEIFTKGDHDHWKFVTGSKDAIESTVVGGFGLYMKENVGETRLPGLEVAHSNRVALVNEDGIVVATFLGTREADMTKLRRILTGKADFPEPAPGISFTRTDGSPLPIELQTVPSDDSTDDEREDSATIVSPDQTTADDAESKREDAAPTNGDGSGTSAPASSDDEQSVEKFNESINKRLPAWARNLPAWNAGLNSLAAVLLVNGFFAIKSQKRTLHRNLMIAAFLTSVVFLASYLTYHYALGKYTGEHGRKFSGSGASAVVYQLILWPHIVLAAAVPVMAIQVFRHAFAERWDAHKKLARRTFPIWMFVSVTGVIIYGMLYHWPAS